MKEVWEHLDLSEWCISKKKEPAGPHTQWVRREMILLVVPNYGMSENQKSGDQAL